MTELFLLLVYILSFIGLMIYSLFSWGFVTHSFYNWFILPIFPTLPQISIIQMIGIMFFVLVLMRNSSEEKEKKDKSKKIALLLLPWTVYIIGLLFKTLFY